MSDPSTPPTIIIGELSVQLIEPPSLMSMALNRRRNMDDPQGEDAAMDLAFGAAALRMCWPRQVAWPATPRPAAWVPGVRLARYGYDVWEGLRKATKGTVPSVDMQRAVMDAYIWAIGCGYTADELQGMRDFSEGQGEE